MREERKQLQDVYDKRVASHEKSQYTIQKKIRDGVRIQKVAGLIFKRDSRKFIKSIIHDVTWKEIAFDNYLTLLMTHIHASIMI